ncbi:sialidase family protein [Microlunatus sp. Y2014]|uniref:sialidase family protein n=1 Tax=Microlunatus sp. Y2014 TaxID=3418488 RepID=UPI003DA77CB5
MYSPEVRRRVHNTTEPDVIIARGEGDRNTYFPDLVRLRGGDLLAVHYGSTQHMHTPDSTIRLVHGTADGRLWDDPRTVVDTPGMDDRDPSVCQLDAGRIMITWFRRDPLDLESPVGGVLTIHSDDDGRTWSEPIGVGTSLYRGATTAPPIELADGRLLLPMYGFHSDQDRTYAVRIAVSPDRGASWDVAAEVSVPMPAEPGVGLVEPELADLGDGKLLMVIRSRNHPENLAYATRSDDAGTTWQVPRPLDFPGHAPNLLPLPGPEDTLRLLLTWGEYRADDTSTRPVLGRLVDGHDPDLAGETFEIYAHPGTFDMSYPSAALVDPTTALVIHYDADRRQIAGTFVAVDQPQGRPTTSSAPRS